MKLHLLPNLHNYLRATFVFFIDLVVSMLSSACVLLFMSALGVGVVSSKLFIITWIVGSLVCSMVGFAVTNAYRIVIRYSTLRELGKLVDAVMGKDLLLTAAVLIFAVHEISGSLLLTAMLLDFAVTFSCLLLVRIMMVYVYDSLMERRGMATGNVNTPEKKRVLVYSTNEKSLSLVTRLLNSSHFEVAGFLSTDSVQQGKILRGYPIYTFSNDEDIIKLHKDQEIDGVLFSHPADARAEKDRLIEIGRHAGLQMFVAPVIDELHEGSLLASGVRQIKIEDLLGRTEIDIEEDEVREQFEGKTVLVTGAAGSIGSELCRQLAKMGISRLIMVDNAETPLHTIRLEFEDKFKWVDFVPVIADVRIEERIDFVFRNYRPQVVFHAAAYKHVPLMEENPCEAVLVNVLGSRLIADKCVEYDVEKVVMISTDKAVNPTNIMGCTKRLAEIYVQSLGLAIQRGEVNGKTVFVTTRFGNVLGSNGSVIPRFSQQIAEGGPVTVTHPEICRFFMTIPEACRLVMEAAYMADGTNIFVFDMGTPVKIADMAARMIHLAGFEVGTDIEIKYTGLRPGEKLYEEVLASKENTLPTENERIFKAKVREYAYSGAREVVDGLTGLARKVNIPDMVRMMKHTVPEFISKHSEFEIYDKEIASEKANEEKVEC